MDSLHHQGTAHTVERPLTPPELDLLELLPPKPATTAIASTAPIPFTYPRRGWWRR